MPLNELYVIMASCNYFDNQVFCPVLIRMVDPTILELNFPNQYLLQVWSNKGEMVFERAMVKPVVNWNIVEDKFLFQEEAGKPEIFMVRLFIER